MDMRTITDPIYHGGDKEKMKEMNNIYYEMADYLKQHDMTAYKKYTEKAEAIAYEMPLEEAKQTVMAMQPYRQRWSYEEVKEYIKDKGVTDKAKQYYLVMNMCYNDYHRTAQKYGADTPDFYFDLAHDFITDPDGGKYKVQKYFAYNKPMINR